ncbi:MAG: hypothetical protein LBQ42_07235 [Synergistaceae bacterium]|nr:hypothetical protein [Synergistaceae bacterium]
MTRKNSKKIFTAAAVLVFILFFTASAIAAVREFENISVEVPDGWQSQEDENGGVTLLSPDSEAVVVVMVAAGDAEGGDSKTYAEVLSDGQKGTVPRDMGGGRYAFTMRNGYGKTGHMCAWAENGTGFAVMSLGRHPELAAIEASIKIRGEHPDIESMWAALDDAGDFGHFSVEIPAGWTANDDNAGSVVITSPGMAAVVMVTSAVSAEGEEDTETLMKSTIEGIESQGSRTGAPEKTDGGFYRISCTNATGATGFVLVGVEDGISDAVTVMGEHRDLKTLILSLKVGYGRNQLAKMFREATK